MAPKALFAVCVGFFSLGAVVVATCGCTRDRWIQGVENASAVAQYSALLATCREKGRAAQDYAVYESCADDVDRMLCTVNVAFCPDGGR